LEYEPASIGERILATLIDYVIFIAWAMLLLLVMAGIGRTATADNMVFGAVMVLILLPITFYDLICEVFFNGQSLGKMAMKIRVVMLDGSPPTLGAYLIRWLLRIVDTRLLSGLVAVVAIAANGRGQRVGDLAAGTTVVKLAAPLTLDEVVYETLPENYSLTFPEAGQLSDRDIQVIRQVLHRGNEEVVRRTADKVKEVTQTQTMLPARRYLEIMVADYQFIVSQKD